MNIFTKHICILFATLGFMNSCSISDISDTEIISEQKSSPEKMLIVLAAPSIENEYYSEYFDDIVDFQVTYMKKVIETGNDEIRILIDQNTQKYYNQKIDKAYIISTEMYDIWMRDFSLVDPYKLIQFQYTDASMSKTESIRTQKIFNDFISDYNIETQATKYTIDGGNIVDNYHDKAITTTRFLTDNNLTYNQGKKILKDLVGVSQVAIIEADDEVLAHADGMVAWIENNTLLVNDYSKIDPEFHEIVIEELEYSFPDINIITIPVEFDEDEGVDTQKGIGSACGVNINLVMTPSTLYVPVFGNDSESKVLEIIQQNTSKTVVTIPAKNICKFGGSVRCTSWQIAGENMKKFLQ